MSHEIRLRGRDKRQKKKNKKKWVKLAFCGGGRGKRRTATRPCCLEDSFNELCFLCRFLRVISLSVRKKNNNYNKNNKENNKKKMKMKREKRC